MKYLIALAAALLFCSCSTTAPNPQAGQTAPSELGGLAIYLAIDDPLPGDVSFPLHDLALFDGQSWSTLLVGPVPVSSGSIGAGQLLLGFFPLPPGQYSKIRFTPGDATVNGKSLPLQYSGDEAAKEISFDLKLHLQPGSRSCLSLTWSVRPSVGDRLFAPVVVPMLQTTNLTRELLFAACDSLDTVFVIRMDTDHVVSCFAIRGRPSYLQMDAASETLYILAEQAREITGVDVYGNRDLSTISLSGGIRAPRYWSLSEDGRWAYVTDHRNYLLQKIEIGSGFVERQVSLQKRPDRVISFILDEPGRARHHLLAVSLPDAQLVALYDPDTLELLDPATLGPAGRSSGPGISTGSNPAGLLYDRGILYICDSGTNTVSMFDLVRNQLVARIPVGMKPKEMVIGKYNRVYVSNSGSGSIAVLPPGQLSPLKDIRMGFRPSVMAKYSRRSRLYVAAEDEGAIAAMDLNSDRTIMSIPLPAPARSLATLE